MGSGLQGRASPGQGRQPLWQRAAQARLHPESLWGWAGSPSALSLLARVPNTITENAGLGSASGSPGLCPWPRLCLPGGLRECLTPLVPPLPYVCNKGGSKLEGLLAQDPPALIEPLW